MIALDTSALIDVVCGYKRSLGRLVALVEVGERVVLPALVVYEWLRGPRSAEELSDQQLLFKDDALMPFDAEDAALAARLYRSVKRPRGREVDLAIAAWAIRHEAELWTFNRADFADIPGLRLYRQ